MAVWRARGRALLAVAKSSSDDTEQVHLILGMQSLPRRDPQSESLDVVNHVFGGGLSSRLFDEIRELRGLAYSVYSGVSRYDDTGSFTMYAGTQPEHAAQVLELMYEQLDLLLKDGITDDELDIAKGYLTGAHELGLEDTGARMAKSASSLISGYEPGRSASRSAAGLQSRRPTHGE